MTDHEPECPALCWRHAASQSATPVDADHAAMVERALCKCALAGGEPATDQCADHYYSADCPSCEPLDDGE